ncbi:MAG TPA: ABC transporter permease, partial [Nitriliruptorales bacterium]
AWKQLRRNPMFLVPAGLVLLLMVMAAFPGLFTSIDPRSCTLSDTLGGIPRPSADHWFGLDVQGCDYYSRVIYGARVSVFIGISVTVFALAIAIVLGSVAAFYGGWIDSLISRLTDVWFAIPTILGAIVILTTLGGRVVPIVHWQVKRQGFAQVVLVLIVLGWPQMTRLVRSSVLQAKEADYVDAARVLGASDRRIILRHILPNAITPVIVYSTITVGIIIAAEAALSFLGVGLRLPSISWGIQLSIQPGIIRQNPHLAMFPGVFLSVAVFSFILLGDALRDALDPKLR